MIESDFSSAMDWLSRKRQMCSRKGALMARILVTGSSDGLGLMAARLLVEDGHEVTLHARNDARADDARNELPAAMDVVVGDLSSISGMRQVAEQANVLGKYHAVIHNAGIGYREPRRIETVDGLSHVFAINVLAPYLVTALMTRPDRLVYLSSGMHRGGDPDLSDLQWERRPWNGAQAYADSKLFDVVLAFSVARRWPDVLSNALEPGWVPTKMGGPALLTIWPWLRLPRSGLRPATTLRQW
jgi:NAD(P)-dependent dehydrogenase (short-subunit alcohol dehydrogenase family)